jgi:hypothetical protein
MLRDEGCVVGAPGCAAGCAQTRRPAATRLGPCLPAPAAWHSTGGLASPGSAACCDCCCHTPSCLSLPPPTRLPAVLLLRPVLHDPAQGLHQPGAVLLACTVVQRAHLRNHWWVAGLCGQAGRWVGRWVDGAGRRRVWGCVVGLARVRTGARCDGQRAGRRAGLCARRHAVAGSAACPASAQQ